MAALNVFSFSDYLNGDGWDDEVLTATNQTTSTDPIVSSQNGSNDMSTSMSSNEHPESTLFQEELRLPMEPIELDWQPIQQQRPVMNVDNGGFFTVPQSIPNPPSFTVPSPLPNPPPSQVPMATAPDTPAAPTPTTDEVAVKKEQFKRNCRKPGRRKGQTNKARQSSSPLSTDEKIRLEGPKDEWVLAQLEPHVERWYRRASTRTDFPTDPNWDHETGRLRAGSQVHRDMLTGLGELWDTATSEALGKAAKMLVWDPNKKRGWKFHFYF